MLNVDTLLILQFLDLEDPKKQAEFLRAHQDDMTDMFLKSAAVSLDFVETSTDIQLRCQDMIRFLNTKVKYEKRRLR